MDMDELLFHNDECLICGSKALVFSDYERIVMKCKNKCCKYLELEVTSNLKSYEFYIFDSYFVITEKRDDYGYFINDKRDLEIVSDVEEKIKYWKENERYLMRLMDDGK